MAENEYIKYEEDIDYWIKRSPNALFDRLKDLEVKPNISQEQWRELCNRVQKSEQGYR